MLVRRPREQLVQANDRTGASEYEPSSLELQDYKRPLQATIARIKECTALKLSNIKHQN